MEEKMTTTTMKNHKPDRLISLPEDIIHQILNLASINTKQVVQLSILSTNWRYFWKSFPIINIKLDDFSNTYQPKEKNFIDCVDKILTSHADSAVHKFYLNSDYVSMNGHLISKLIHYLILGNVQEINLEGSWIKIPIFSVATLVNRNQHLRTLKLNFVHLEDAQNRELVLSSSSLENLIIYHDLNCITIHCDQLKYLKIHNVTQDICEVKVRAPNLTRIHCKGMFFHDYSLEDLSSMVDAHVDIICMGNWDEEDVSTKCINNLINLLENARSLTLTAGFFQANEGSPDIWSDLPSFPNIKYLKVTKWYTNYHIHTLAKFMEKFSSIESLVLQNIQEEEWEQDEEQDEEQDDDDERDWDTQLAFQCNYYNLKSLDFQFLEGEENELMFIEFLLKGAPTLESISITAKETISEDKSKMSALREKLHSLPSYCSRIAISIK